MADDNDSLLREVDEELRRERMEKLWQRYNGLILGAAALIIFSVMGYQWLESRRIASAEAAGAEFAAAETLTDDKKKDEAEKAFATIADTGPAGYAALARLRLAGAEAKAGKTAEALATYESLAKSSGADDLLKSFAQLQAAALRLPDADYAEMQNRLTPLAGDDSPYSKSANELLGIAAYQAKKYDDARKYLEPLLIDPNAADGVQDRVKVALAAITAAESGNAAPQASAAPEAAPANPPAAPAAAEPAKTEAKPEASDASGADKK